VEKDEVEGMTEEEYFQFLSGFQCKMCWVLVYPLGIFQFLSGFQVSGEGVQECRSSIFQFLSGFQRKFIPVAYALLSGSPFNSFPDSSRPNLHAPSSMALFYFQFLSGFQVERMGLGLSRPGLGLSIPFRIPETGKTKHIHTQHIQPFNSFPDSSRLRGILTGGGI